MHFQHVCEHKRYNSTQQWLLRYPSLDLLVDPVDVRVYSTPQTAAQQSHLNPFHTGPNTPFILLGLIDWGSIKIDSSIGSDGKRVDAKF